MSQSMPQEFLGRLRADTANVDALNSAARTGMTWDVLEAVLAGKMTLTADKVASVAKRMKKPVEEYLLLAGYVPSGLKRLFFNKDMLAVIRVAAKLPADDLQVLGQALNSIFTTAIKYNTKKKEGS